MKTITFNKFFRRLADLFLIALVFLALWLAIFDLRGTAEDGIFAVSARTSISEKYHPLVIFNY